MKQYICQGCSERCGSTASDRPSQCLFEKDSKSPKWVLVEEAARNNYITVPRLILQGETDWKLAFAMMCSSFGDSVVRTCHVCQVLGAKCSGDRSCGSIIIEAIKRKCTKGGE